MMNNGLQCITDIPVDKRLCALIDLDGTMFHGSQMIAGADQLVTALHEMNIPLLFVTNNSTRTPDQVADLLRSMGIPASVNDVVTTSQAAADYISEHYSHERVYMIGEQGLQQALTEANIDWTSNPEEVYQDNRIKVVVQGLDREMTYEKLEAAAIAIRNGAAFISTNPDLMLPSDKGISPGAGTLAAAIQAASGTDPIYMGKPHRIIMDVALKRMGCTADEAIVIGDNMLTDMMAGINAGCYTALVLTGVTTTSNLAFYIEKIGTSPDLICDNLDVMKQWFESRP